MLSLAKTLKGYRLHALDGDIGTVKEFYFDDRHWTVRYLVAETGTWLASRKVLISPHALGTVDEEERRIVVDLTKTQIEDSPSLDSDKPVSRQFEAEYYRYYGLPMYWGSTYNWRDYPYIECERPNWNSGRDRNAWDSHLRSTREVAGYCIHATDGKIGHVEEFLIDDETWTIRYLIVDTRNWWPGKRVLVAPQWIERVRWSESDVFVNLSREAIRRSPEFSAESLPTRDDEIGLYRHYDRLGYWGEVPAEKQLARI